MKTFSQYLTEGLLLEDKTEFLVKKYSGISTAHDHYAQHKDAASIVNHFATTADPTPNKKHLGWIMNQYSKGNVRQEDSPAIHTALSDFDKYKPKLQEKDLGKYSHLADLQDAVEPHKAVGGPITKGDEEREAKAGAQMIHDGPNTRVHKITTKASACFYGKGTRWCTAGDKNNQAENKLRDGPLYIITHKKEKDESGRPEKHQIHFETDEFADSRNVQQDLDDYVKKNPELMKVNEFKTQHPSFNTPEENLAMIKAHYGVA